MGKKIILHIFFLMLMKATFSFKPDCNTQKECVLLNDIVGHVNSNLTTFKCLLTDKSQLILTKAFEKIDGKKCEKTDFNIIDKLSIRPKKEGSIIFKKGMIDLEDLIRFELMLNFTISDFEIQLFKGFELNLYDDSFENNDTELILNYLKQLGIMFFRYSTLDFYQKDKKLTSCKEFIEATNATNPRSILQVISKISNLLHWTLTENRNNLCPFAFKDFYMSQLYFLGENSFYSKKTLSFSNDTIKDLNSTIIELQIYIFNVELNMDFLHPGVFKQLLTLKTYTKVKQIHPDLFIWLNRVYFIGFKNEFMRSLMHNSGIEWIRNINKYINCSLENSNEVRYYISGIKYIFLECFNNPISPPLIDVFPEEDFCLYKDFPVNQLVLIIERCKSKAQSGILNKKISCTYLWITRSYEYLIDELNRTVDYIYVDFMRNLLNSSDYKSISNCNFEKKLELCNKSNFVSRHFITSFEISEAMKLTETVINILSHILSIFGIITNFLIILTISIKKNKEDFKGYKHYSYLRLNSIFSCLILLIHLISWLNQCIYPYQVFCPIIRKTVFMQYFKIIVEEVLMTALKFMNSFTYIGFAFCRISLIGKDHNKLVKFMSDLNLIVYIVVTSIISIGLSIIKFFEYDINPGHPFESYPITYDDNNLTQFGNKDPTLYILNLISDLFNFFIFSIVNLVIDIGMIVKLRQTLNEKLEKSKEYATKAQQEKSRLENETALNKTRSMVIWNISLNIFLKLPATSFSIIHLYFIVFRSNLDNFFKYPGFVNFFTRICINGYLCTVLSQFTNFLYLFYISIQLFFYKHYDKKFSQSYDRLFRDKKSN